MRLVRRLALGTTAVVLLAAAGAHGAATTAREPAFGLPHIFADTDLELARENGRQIARDRLVQMILLSRVGRGTLYQAFGVLDPTTLSDDVEARRTAYTSSELNGMYAKLPPDVQAQLFEYCKGVNDVIDQIYAGSLPEPLEIDIIRTVLGLPFDLFGNQQNVSDQFDPSYAPPGGAWPNSGFQFTPEMVMAIAILEVRNFGLGGFDEVALLQQLQGFIAKHGTSFGTEIWDDLNFLVDPLAPVSVPDSTTPGFGGPLAKAPAATSTRLAAADRFPAYDYATSAAEGRFARADREERARALGAWPAMGSYAWAIAGNKTANGWPWIGGFPQTGIQTPSIMHFVENRSAEGASHQIEGIGMEFAGAGAVVLIGQTDSVAYTTTTAQLRVIDTFLEEIVGENAAALRYVDHAGAMVPLSKRIETFLGGLAPTALRTFWRSHAVAGNGGSRPVTDFIGDAEGTADSGTATTLVDAAKFGGASWVGGHVAIVDGPGAGQIRQITGNPDANTVAVAAWGTTPTNASVYVAVRPGSTIMAATVDSPTWLEESTTALGFIQFQRAETILDIRAATRVIPSTHNFVAADNKPFDGIGTQNGNGNIGFWTSGYSRKRQGGLDSRLPMDGSNASNPLIVASGTVASAGPSDLSAVGSPFTGDDFSPESVNYRYLNPTQQGSDFIVSITTGTGAKQTRRIASNTASDLVVEWPWGLQPAAGDTFEVYEIVAQPEAANPAEGYTANWNNKSATADEGENFGRQFRHIFILERLAAENAWDRNKQRQLNKDLAGLDGRGDYGRFIIPKLRQAVDRVGNGGEPAVDTVLAALEAFQTGPFLGRGYVDPVTATTVEGELSFLNSVVNRLAKDIYEDEYQGVVGNQTGSRALNTVQHAIDTKEGAPAGRYEQAYAGDYFRPFDDFTCHKATTTTGTPRFQKQFGLSLTDQFETAIFDALGPRAICPPAVASGGSIEDQLTHFESYKIRRAAQQPAFPRQFNVTVVTPLQTLQIDVLQPERLLVPTGKRLGAPADPPPAGMDHFKCHRIRLTPGGPNFQRVTFQVSDQFLTRVYELRRVSRFCTPVDKAGSGITRPEAHLMCFKPRIVSGGTYARIRGQIHTNNQFGVGRLDTLNVEELCLPALKNPPAGVKGWEFTVRDSLKALAPGGIPADAARSNSTYNHPLAGLFPVLSFPPTPQGNRGTWEQIVEVAPTVDGEMMFPLGQSGHIEGTIGGVTFIDPNVLSLHPIWRDWRFVPMIHVGEDLAAGNADADSDGVFDGWERWYYGNTSVAATGDTDGDGSDLLAEFNEGSDPTDVDTDDDGILDGPDAKPQDRLLP